MKFLHLPFPLFFILQLFAVLVRSQDASSSSPTITSSMTSGVSTLVSANATASATAGTTNSSSSATPTSSAQFPSLSGVSTCVTNCLANASANLNCTSEVDVNCFCNNPGYPAQLVDCVLGNCSDQVSTIETLGQEFCNQASGQLTLSFFSVPITTTTTSASSSSSSPSSSSTSTSTSTAPSSSTTSAAKPMNGSTNLIGLGAIILLGIFLCGGYA